MTLSRERSAIILIVVLALLTLGWVWGVWRNWGEIVTRPVRLAYIICDVGFVIPVGLVAALGLRRGAPWALQLFPLALGALLFDVAHGVFYLLWDNYFRMPPLAGFAILAATVVYVVAALRGLKAGPAQ